MKLLLIALAVATVSVFIILYANKYRIDYITVSPECQMIHREAITGRYYGACYKDFWDKYKKCFGSPMTATGCYLVKGETGKPECYRENCL